MTAPSWPRLASRVRRAQTTTLQGRWRTHDGTGSFAHRSPDRWVTLDEDGGLSDDHDVRHTVWAEFDRGDHGTAAGPVTAVHHDGRLAWQVELVPPPHKRGLLTVVVDDATGIVLRKADAAAGGYAEVLELVVDAPLPEGVFAARAARDAEHEREAARYALAQRRPVPTPQWFPWRRGWSESPDLRVVETDHGDGSVGRAPLGRAAPVTSWIDPASVHRLDHLGWSWAVASEQPLHPDEARRVVEQVDELDGR